MTRAAAASGRCRWRRGRGLGNNLMALAINAARAKATVGEISDALEKVYGRHQARDPHHLEEFTGTRSGRRQHHHRTIRGQPAGREIRRGRWPTATPSWSPRWGRTVTTAGRRVIATAFADIGFDVDVGSLFSTPDRGGAAGRRQAIRRGVSSLAAGHLTLVPALRDALAQVGRPDIMIVVGGVIPTRRLRRALRSRRHRHLPAGDRGCRDRLAAQARRTPRI